MAFTLGLAQVKHPHDGDVIALVENTAEAAKERHVDMLIFPESLMTRFEEEIETFIDEAQSTDGPFVSAMAKVARRFSLWLIFTMNEKNEDSRLPFNTAIIMDDEGEIRAKYRKVHLFDSKTVKESTRMSAGDELFSPIDTPFGKIGLGICYDLRFPEFARKQALEGCKLMIYMAAWVDGPNKAIQWKSLLRGRAIENEFFVAGVCRPDKGYVGESYVFGPDGSLCASINPHEDTLQICEIDLKEVKAMREMIPSLDHRRSELY